MVGENSIIRFGVFELDVQAGVLRKSGIRIKLQDQPLQILSILLERPGDVLTREELRNRLWPDGTFVDFDHSLNASMNKLREALGDAASNPRFVETMPRRGYRFIAPVERIQAAKPAPPPAAAPESSRSWTLRNKVAVAAAMAVLAMAGAAVAIRWPVSTGRERIPAVVPLTSSPGMELQPTFSPDGNYVAYTGGPENGDVYIKQIDSETVQRLTSNPAPDVSPKWSPDGRRVAFARRFGQQDPEQLTVLIIPALGGAEHKVADVWIPHHQNRLDWVLDWFPDAENMVIVDGDASGQASALVGLNTRTGERWRLTTPPAIGSGDVDPAVSPDGRRLVFTRTSSHENTDLYVLELNEKLRPAGEPQVLLAGAGSQGAAWTPDGQEILFASGAFLQKRLSRMRVEAGSIPELLPFAAEGTWLLSAAVSRRWQVAYVRSRGEVDLYRTDLKTGGKSARSTRFLSSTFFDSLPEYSPDGKRIAFVSNRSGSQQIWVSDADGENAHQLTFLSGNSEATWPRWAPDGGQLVFTVGRSVYLVSADGGPPTVRFKDVASREAVADWSRDGRWIYFLSNSSGRDEVWKTLSQPGKGGDQATQVTRNGAGAFRASPDENFVYYARGTRPAELWRTAVEDSQEMRVADKLSTSGSFAVTVDGTYFFPPADETGRASLIFMDARSLSQRVVASLEGAPLWGLTISADGRYALHSAGTGGESDLMLVGNFR